MRMKGPPPDTRPSYYRLENRRVAASLRPVEKV